MKVQTALAAALSLGLAALAMPASAAVVGPVDVDPCCSPASERTFLTTNADMTLAWSDQGVALDKIEYLGKLEFDEGGVSGNGVFDATEKGISGDVKFDLSVLQGTSGSDVERVAVNQVIAPASWRLLGLLVVSGKVGGGQKKGDDPKKGGGPKKAGGQSPGDSDSFSGRLGTFWFADMLEDVGLVESVETYFNGDTVYAPNPGAITYFDKGISHITAFGVQAVPLPAAVYLLGTGLVGLGLLGRRRRGRTA